jgi:hypothetical protein
VQDPDVESGSEGAPEPPEFSTSMALVLQLSATTGPALRPFVGRVEHVSTGRRVRFDSLEGFQAAVVKLLSEAKPRT